MVALSEVLAVIIMSIALIVQIFALRNINKVNNELEPHTANRLQNGRAQS